MAVSGLVPVAEIQFRKYADPATEQLNNCGTMRWRTHNQFAAPIVVRMPGGFGKDVGDPWHSLSSEVTWVHAIGWQVLMPSNAADAVGLLRAAMRSRNPSIFFEHRSLLMTSDGSARYPGDDYIVPLGQATRLRSGERCVGDHVGCHGPSVPERRRPDSKIASKCWISAQCRRGIVMPCSPVCARPVGVSSSTRTRSRRASVQRSRPPSPRRRSGGSMHPVERLAVEDVPMPYHEVLLDAVLPDADGIARAIERMLGG